MQGNQSLSGKQIGIHISTYFYTLTVSETEPDPNVLTVSFFGIP